MSTSKTQRLLITAAIALALGAGGAAAQQRAHRTVSKCTSESTCGDIEKIGMYRTIQEAVNDANPGEIIEILDIATYEEQVTIEGRDNRNWPGRPIKPAVGKRGITIRYVPPAGAPVTARPVVKFKDTFNVSPKDRADGLREGDTIGSAGNFETNGVFRLLHTSDISIEGLIIDGGGIYPFWGDNAWGTANMAHGNSAVAVVVSGNIQIRDCHLRNAHLGIAVKDRNVGGVYGNKNQADLDTASIVPLSGFGHSGNHLFEYNRIYDNTVGVYFESSWDRGSSVRYNLFYRNYRRSGIAVNGTNAPAAMAHDMDWVGGALKFKDNYLSPVAIYNNTLYENERFLANHYQVGGQHLVFNNIIAGARMGSGNSHGLDGKMPHRMHHNTWSCNDQFHMQSQGGQVFGNQCTPDRMRDTFWISGVQFRFDLPPAANHVPARSYSVTYECNYGGAPQVQTQTVNMPGPMPGALMTSATHFPQSSVNRWLEMSGNTVSEAGKGTITLPNLFLSLADTSANFLEPDWSKQEVIDFVRGKGWAGQGDAVTSPEVATGAGMVDWAGSGRADLGAIQYNGKRPCSSTQPVSRARLTPFSVVTLSGSGSSRRAVAKINVEEEIASGISGLRIKYIRWIEVPVNTGEATERVTVHNITPPSGVSLSQGSNVITFTLPSTVPTTIEYGFFEIVLEGTAGGRTVTTDVGFIPYRDLDYGIRFRVQSVGGSSPTYDIRVRDDGTRDSIPIVRAGEPVVLRVTAVNLATGAKFTPQSSWGTPPLQVTYTLLSNPSTARMWRQIVSGTGRDPDKGRDSVAYEPNLNNSTSNYEKDYTVYFTEVPDNPDREEILSGAGTLISGTSRLAFLGDQPVIVRPGNPARVTFTSPVSQRELPGYPNTPPNSAPVLSGSDNPLEVQVQDRFGNGVDEAVSIAMRASDTGKGDVAVRTVTTNPATGTAVFSAHVTGGTSGDTLRFIATISQSGITGPNAADTALMRIGRPPVRVYVMYKNDVVTNGEGDWAGDFDARIDTLVTTRMPVWVKVVNASADTLVSSFDGFACVKLSADVSSSNLRLFTTESGDPVSADAGIMINIQNGVGKFWVTSDVETDNEYLSVSVKRENDCNAQRDAGVNDGAGSSGDIRFYERNTSILSAVVFSDNNGYGRPNRVEIEYDDQGGTATFENTFLKEPTKVKLLWPSSCGTEVTATSIEASGTTVTATFNADAFPSDFTAIIGSNTQMLLVTDDKDVEAGGIPLTEKVGPLIAGDADEVSCGSGSRAALEGPSFEENLTPGVTPDVLTLQLTEALGSGASLVGETIQLKKRSGGSVVTLTITAADPTGAANQYKLTVAPQAERFEDGDSVRLNPAATTVTDAAGNGVREDNRYMPIKQKESPASPFFAWYTTNNVSGKADYLYVGFNKAIVHPSNTDSVLTRWFAANGKGKFYFEWTSTLRQSFPVVGNLSADNVKAAIVGLTRDDPAVSAAVTAYLGQFSGEERETKDRQLVGFIRIDLAEAFPLTKDIDAPMTLNGSKPPVTGGNIRVDITFGHPDHWNNGTAAAPTAKTVPGDARDRAWPVLRSATLKIGAITEDGDETPDTLILTYSETINSERLNNATNPVRLKTVAAGFVDLELTPIPRTVGLDTMKYIVHNLPTDNIDKQNRDTVWINREANLEDGGGNRQDAAENYRVPLKFEAGDVHLKVVIANNPGSPSRPTRIEIDPMAKGSKVDIEIQIIMFSNMGNVVIDTMINNHNTTESKLTWTWHGQNKKGRTVGTGTYIFKAIYKVDGETKEIRRPVGFVRRKGEPTEINPPSPSAKANAARRLSRGRRR